MMVGGQLCICNWLVDQQMKWNFSKKKNKNWWQNIEIYIYIYIYGVHMPSLNNTDMKNKGHMWKKQANKQTKKLNKMKLNEMK